MGVFGRQGKEAAVATSVAGEHPGKDQKVVEIETAAMVAERLVDPESLLRLLDAEFGLTAAQREGTWHVRRR